MDTTASVEDQKAHCISLCQDHFGNSAWLRVKSKEQIDQAVKPIRGGTSNLIYLCKLPVDIASVNGEPRSVLIRFYERSQGNHSAILTDTVVLAILGERGLAPKLYGCFNGGRFEEYIPTRALLTHELKDPYNMKQIATKMAEMHRSSLPVIREPVMLRSEINGWFASAMANAEILLAKDPEIWSWFLSKNIPEEKEQLLKVLYSSDSPVLFCHNDVQEGNVLIGPNGQDHILIDFEYSGYNFRGHDFANHFIEWCLNYSNTNPPYYIWKPEDYPTVDQQRIFFSYYLEAMGVPQESFESETQKLMEEADFFLMSTHFFWGMWSFHTAAVSEIEFSYMQYGKDRLMAYFDQKEKYKDKFRPLSADA